VTERIPTPGWDDPHGQALDLAEQVMFVGCEANAKIVSYRPHDAHAFFPIPKDHNGSPVLREYEPT
jgi:hypothetical protein